MLIHLWFMDDKDDTQEQMREGGLSEVKSRWYAFSDWILFRVVFVVFSLVQASEASHDYAFTKREYINRFA